MLINRFPSGGGGGADFVSHIKVTIRDNNNNLIQGASVYAYNSDYSSNVATTNADGLAIVELEKFGTYTLRASLPNRPYIEVSNVVCDTEYVEANMSFLEGVINFTSNVDGYAVVISPSGIAFPNVDIINGAGTLTIYEQGEYSIIYNYSNSEKTYTKTFNPTIIGTPTTIALDVFKATLTITSDGESDTTVKIVYPDGSTLFSYNAEDNNPYVYTVLEKGIFTCTAENPSKDTETATADVQENKNYDIGLGGVKIYGISRTVGINSTAWTRTDDAVGKTATASIGTVAGHSDFDDIYPWSEMKRETLSTGDVMVKIPEFYYQRYVDSGVEYIKIVDKPTNGFLKHPGSGKYIGAYKTSSNNKSVKGVAPTVRQTRATMRTNAKAKGTGWSLNDKATESAIQMLYLVEFADNNAQAKIGRGYCDANSAAISTGSCDSVPNLTGRPAGTDGKTDVVYRGIEGFWGNIWEWLDGLNFNNGEYWVCTDPTKYADDTSSNYTKLSYTGATNWSGSYITTEGMDNSVPWAMMPSAAGSGSETTGYADGVWSSTGWRVLERGGAWSYASLCGVFTAIVNYASSNTNTNIGSRLLFTPS